MNWRMVRSWVCQINTLDFFIVFLFCMFSTAFPTHNNSSLPLGNSCLITCSSFSSSSLHSYKMKITALLGEWVNFPCIFCILFWSSSFKFNKNICLFAFRICFNVVYLKYFKKNNRGYTYTSFQTVVFYKQL